MKAIIRSEYGSPDVLELADLDVPVVDEDGVLVRVRAASLNAADLDYLYGKPLLTRMGTGLRTPRNRGLGLDAAGQVEAVGRDVTTVPAGGRRVRGPHRVRLRRLRRARGRPGARLGAEARRHDLRGGRDRAAGGDPGPAGPARQGTTRPGGPAGAGQRCVGQRWPVRRADRESLRRGGDRRLQHGQDGPGSRARRRSRHRLHAGGRQPGRPALRLDRRRRGQPPDPRLAARAEARRHLRHGRGSHEPHPRGARAGAGHLAGRQPQDGPHAVVEALQEGGRGRPRRAHRGRQDRARDRSAIPAGRRLPTPSAT